MRDEPVDSILAEDAMKKNRDYVLRGRRFRDVDTDILRHCTAASCSRWSPRQMPRGEICGIGFKEQRPQVSIEGLPAAVVLIPVVFPIATGVNPIHFDIVQTAAVGIGLFLPPMGVGLLMALRFAEVPVSQHAPYYWPYVMALLIGLMLIICLPELSLTIPRSAGFVR
jgi:hypothetical protein